MSLEWRFYLDWQNSKAKRTTAMTDDGTLVPHLRLKKESRLRQLRGLFKLLARVKAEKGDDFVIF
ncbi:hypothetical protein GCM10007978_06420 [Shewanella hanedai]|nr:hypothetical protein GCM10007978_06420 [Shewanella hanedai]